jgi:hypothetical protein
VGGGGVDGRRKLDEREEMVGMLRVVSAPLGWM